ncbi:MAG: hypothetical protein LBE78_13070 [Burkholderiaceae bacterium]|jgi:hypothetical protein|nr:hypothetical protein [Burkholderiaceae bacterium]
MTTQADIQKRAETLSQTRDALADLLRTLHAEIETVKLGSLPEIRRSARKVAEDHNKLKTLIEANPELFERPRTHVVAGLKYGLQKQRGKMDWDSDEQLCARIRRLAAVGVVNGGITYEQADLLIVTTERPVAKALEKLDGKLLKRLGVTVAADTDEVLIKSVDSEVEKAVNAVIKDVTKDENAEVTV